MLQTPSTGGGTSSAAPSAAGRPTARRDRTTVARLVARVYGGADAPVRARVLATLLAPLGTLGRAAVAAGAFAVFARPGGPAGLQIDPGDVDRYSVDQVAELARFAEQVSPEAVAGIAGAVLDSPAGLTTFALLAALALARWARERARP